MLGGCSEDWPCGRYALAASFFFLGLAAASLFAAAACAISLPEDRLFVEAAAHGWAARDERALAAFYTGRVEEARDLWEGLLAGDDLPESERARVEANLSFTPPREGAGR